MDVHKFTRKLHIKRYMLSNPMNGVGNVMRGEYQHSNLSNASLFNPPGPVAPAIRVFRDVVLRDLEQIRVKKANLHKDLQVGLESLCHNKSLVIRPADKGGGIVILDRCDYQREMHRLVDDTETYTVLQRDPLVRYKKELESIVEVGFRRGILNDKERRFLVPSAPCTPVIYYLPKVHKDPVCPRDVPL